MIRVKPGEPLEDFLTAPLEDDCIRVMHYTACGAVTYYRIGSTAVGDPELHNQWHSRGLLTRIRKILRQARALDIPANTNSRTKGTKMTDQPQSPPSGARLALHLASQHADPMAAKRGRAENEDRHRHEHAGPGTIRDHGEGDFSYDAKKAGSALLEAGEQELPPDYAPEEEETARPDGEEALRGRGGHLFASYPTMSFRVADSPPAPRPPHEIADLARMIGDMHDQDTALPADLIAVDLAWIKTAGWPWRRRMRAAALIAFPLAWPPSWYLDRRVREAVRK